MNKMKLTKLFLMAAASFSFACCTHKEPTKDQAEAPKFVSVTPADKTTDLPYEGQLSVVFTYDQNIRCATADKKKITVDNEATVASVSAYDATLTLKIDGLKENTTYVVTIPAGVVNGYKENQEGAAAQSVSFTTKSAPLPPEPGPDPTPGEGDPWKILAKLKLGFNLGNHFDAFYNYQGAGEKFLWPDETCWGNAKCTQATFTGLYNAGFRSVRIPITWLKTIGPAPDYKIDEAWMKRIKEVVGFAKNAGLQVIINTHHDEDHYLTDKGNCGYHRWLNIIDATKDEAVNTQIKEEIRVFWTNVANEFKAEGDYLIFESFNEINDGKWGGSANSVAQAQVLNQWNQVFVDAIRATGGNNATRWLGVPTYCASPSTKFIGAFKLPTDPANHTMLAVHCYDPYDYTLGEGCLSKRWGHTMGNSWDEQAVKDVLATLFSNFINKNIPVYMGEFGCSMRAYNTADWRCEKYYLEYFVKACKTYGIPCFLWDNGNKGTGSEHHAYIDHGTGAYIDHSKELIDVMVKAMTDESKSYTLESIYDNAPKN